MSELSNELQRLDNSENETGKAVAPAVMLVTMVLLIAVLLFTSLMMVHYSGASKALAGASTDEGTHTAPQAEQTVPIAEQAGALIRSLKGNDSEKEQAEEKSGRLVGLFGNREGGVRWPRLELTGFGTSINRRESFAIINDHQYHPGQLINGKVTLVDVQDHYVVVECQGETRNLTVDNKR